MRGRGCKAKRNIAVRGRGRKAEGILAQGGAALRPKKYRRPKRMPIWQHGKGRRWLKRMQIWRRGEGRRRPKRMLIWRRGEGRHRPNKKDKLVQFMEHHFDEGMKEVSIL